jgi:hypothetical protein
LSQLFARRAVPVLLLLPLILLLQVFVLLDVLHLGPVTAIVTTNATMPLVTTTMEIAAVVAHFKPLASILVPIWVPRRA